MSFLALSLSILIVSALAMLLSARFEKIAYSDNFQRFSAPSKRYTFLRGKKICGYMFLSSLVISCGIGIISALNVLWFKMAPSDLRIPWPMAFGEFYLGIDALSAFFLLLLFILALASGIYGYGYLRDYTGRRSVAAHYSFYHLLIGSIMLILLARNAVLFLIAWELMTMTSYVLITFYDEKQSVRKAGYIYLIATHTGTFCLLVMFLLMGSCIGLPVGPGQAEAVNFDQMMTSSFSPPLAACIFILALIGFGVKAGFIPLHIWLPHAHPAAPSHISALLSGVVIKIGIYGLIRVILIVKDFPSWCGIFLLTVGAVSGVGGVLYALGQHEIKKLLAYHSIENIGIIALGLGMGLMGQAFGQETVAFIGYAGALLHVFNHAIFKGLLFLSAGSVIRATHTGEIDRMGGLLKFLPWTGHLFLIGSLSICGLPLFNGFISEWLVYQALLGGVFHFNIYGIIVSCFAIASLALIGGLAAFCFAKAFGMIFLGKNRSTEEPCYKESKGMLCGPMVVLAAICLWVGLAPLIMVSFCLQAAQTIMGRPVPLGMKEIILNPLLMITSALFMVVIIFAVLAVLRVLLLRGRPLKEAETWGCGYAAASSRMQYTASSFAEPILRIFRGVLVFKVKTVKLKQYFPPAVPLSSHVLDASEDLLFKPVLCGIKKFSKKLNWIQSGHTQRYLLYILFFLLTLLIWKLR